MTTGANRHDDKGNQQGVPIMDNSTPRSSASPSANRVLLVLVSILLGIIVALLAGILTLAEGSQVGQAIMTGAVAFGGTVSLIVFILRTLHFL